MGRGVGTLSWNLPLAFNYERRNGGLEVRWAGKALRCCTLEGGGGSSRTGLMI